MSVLVAAALPCNILVWADPFVDEEWCGEEQVLPSPVVSTYNAHDPPGDGAYTSAWWPGIGGGPLGGFDGVAENFLLSPPMWANVWPLGGANGRFAFVGITRDQYGSPLAGCTVRAFRSSTDELVAKVVSDATGAYIATTPYLEDHYLVIHSADGQQAGASVSTIYPG